MKAKWLNRLLVVSPCYIALCTTEKQFKALLKHLKIPKSSQPTFIATWHSDATTHFFENKEMTKVSAIVCIKHRAGITQSQVAGLLVHEAMHIWQEICKQYGEDSPSHEFEAYSVQNIFQNLLEEFTRQTKGGWDEVGAGAYKFSNWLSSQSRSAARQRGSVGVDPAEYVVTREDGATIKLAKFEGGDLPTAIYRVANVPKGNALAATHAVCDCPAGMHGRQCKHLAIVEEWVRQNERS